MLRLFCGVAKCPHRVLAERFHPATVGEGRGFVRPHPGRETTGIPERTVTKMGSPTSREGNRFTMQRQRVLQCGKVPIMQRRTKIVVTIGPSSEDVATLRDLIRAGMDVARIGLAHGTLDEAVQRYRRVREVAADEGRLVGTLIDLPGPKIRTASFGHVPVELPVGADIELTTGYDRSDASMIEVDHENLINDVLIGDTLDIGDGRVVLTITDKMGDRLVACIKHGGELQGCPGVHIPAERLSMSTPTPSDLAALDVFTELGADMVAISFVRSAHDMRRAATELHPRGPLLVAKIETRAAVENLSSII